MNRILNAITAVLLFLIPGEIFGQAPSLGTAAGFVLFSSVGAVTNTGISHLTGNVGTNSGSSTGFGNVDGVMHDNDVASGAASASLVIAYNQLAAAIPTFFPSSLLGNNDTLLPGVYSIPSAATLNGNLVLNAQGDPNAVFIFQINGSFASSANAKVKIINGGVACNVFWKMEGMVDLGAGTTMIGTIVAHNSAINLNALDTLEGRALAINGAVTLNGLQAAMPLGCGAAILTGPLAPALLSTANYGIFSGIGPVTNTGITHVIGDVGTNSGLTTGFNPLFVTGMIHPVPDGSTAACASDLTTVYNFLNTIPTDIELLYPAQFGNNLVLTAHTYLLNAATTFTDTLYLNAEGNSNAVFVIKVNGALSTSTFSKVILMNGARAQNVYWKVDGAVDVNDNSVFRGNIIANNGAIHLRTGSNLYGRALTTDGAVTIDAMDVFSVSVPSADTITGSSNVCVGSSITLTDTASGGVWSAANGHATVLNGVVTGVTPGIDTISYIVTNVAGSDTATHIVTVTAQPNAGAISGASTVCAGNVITLTDPATGGVWSATNGHAAVIGGVVTGVTSGIDTIRYTVTNTCGADTATKIVTVNPQPNAGTISGASTVCVGTVITLTDATTGGTWTATNTHATVIGGVVTGVTSGIDTIRYTVINTCGSDTATKIVTVNPQPNAGTISGASTVCAGNIITLTDAATGGVWSTTNTHAAVIGGVVTGVTSGIDTIRYTVTNTCGSDTATKIVTVNPQPNAGTISGASAVCVGTVITLTDAATGGVWSATNTHATVLGGVVGGVSTGVDTIMYTVTNTCGTDIASKIITVNPQPNAGTISGASTVCVGTVVTLTDAATGGVWSATNTNDTVTGGVVTGVATGVDTIMYTVTNTCGTDIASKIVTVNPQPNAGTISGASTVCVGTVVTLTDAATGGVWSATNTHATVTGGVVTGISVGVDTIMYTVTNTCGTDIASKIVTVNPQPNAGTISGASTVCIGSVITLTDAATGGVWSATNTNATVTGGVVTGVSTGVDTIMYTVTNTCGTDISSKIITINTVPSAGTISGPSAVCTGTVIALTDAATGGVWSVTNTHATVTGGVVTGISVGVDTIMYTVTNTCGTDIASKIITVNPQPNAGTITGLSNVCVGGTITLADATTGGNWTRSNTNATVIGGVVNGITAGTDTIMYMVTNICGTDTASKIVTIDPLPSLTSSTTPAAICDSALFNYTPTSTVSGTSYTWSRAVVFGLANSANSGTAGISEQLYNITTANKTATYVYTLTANGCSASENVTVVVHPTPKLEITTDSVCTGVPFTFAPVGLTAGSTFTWTTNAVAGVTGSTLAGIGTINDTLISSLTTPVVLIYAYTVTANNCPFVQNVAVTLFPSISAPVITTQSPSAVCTGTMYQNFGTSTPPQAYAPYNWSATNAQVWAQGANSQYAIVSFIHTGDAYVTLTAGIAGTACSSQTTLLITANSSVSSVPTVSYFSHHFVCTPSDEASYQWGYDDATTLDSTILTGEINQDYVCVTPDYVHKFYWVMTTAGGCSQKTYYNAPTAIQNVNNDVVGITVYPNPANDLINVVISSTIHDQVQIDVVNMLGQKVASVMADDNKAAIEVAQLAIGSYMVVCYRNGIKVAGSRFMKN